MKPHIAILPSLGLGHVIPLFELAKRLVIHHGFHVSFLVITTEEASEPQNHLLHSPTLPPDLHVINLPSADISASASAGADNDNGVNAHIILIVKQTLKSLRSILLNLQNPKALIIDIFFTDALDIAKDLSLPTYLFFTASASLLAVSLYFPTLDREVNGEYTDLHGPFQVPGCKPLPVTDLIGDVLKREILPIVSRYTETTGILVNTWEELEPVSLCALRENPFFLKLPTPPVYPIGPLIKEDHEPVLMIGSDASAKCLTWLEEQPSDSVLFVSFGSGGTLSAEQLTEMAWGLELSQQRFIWVTRKPTNVSGLGDEADDPNAYLPGGFLERTQRLGVVVPSWAPQVAVLRHRSTGGFLSHCGWNSLLESILHGVPIIAWPLCVDQKMNARMLIEELEVAQRIEEEEGVIIGRKEIERVVRLVMEGEEGKVMRRRVREVQNGAFKALSGASYKSISHVAGIWKGKEYV